jgi:DNA mismatch repair protein MLH3
MFYLRISLKNDVQSHRPEERLFENGSNLQAVITMLNAMLTQWLSAHHFRPRKSRAKKQNLDTTSTPTGHCDAQAATSTPLEVAFSKMNRGLDTPGVSSPAKSGSRKRKRLSKASPVVSDPNMRTRPFTEWSRIKSGKANFLDNVKLSKQTKHHSLKEPLSETPVARETSSDAPTLDATHPKAGASNVHMDTSDAFTGISSDIPSVDAYNANSQTNTTDAIMEWQDPSSKQTFLLNARTGCAIPRAPSRSHTDRVTTTHATTLTEFNKSLRLPKRPVSEPKDTPWLTSMLKDWDNPVFKTSEQRIQQISLDESCGGGNHHHCSRIEVDKAFAGSSLSGTSKLSKDGLCHARVIAQLDRKFILAKLPNTVGLESSGTSDALVIIDQHAADERIRVEALFAELCAPPITANRNYRSKLGHSSQIAFLALEKPAQFAISSQEDLLFTTHAARFAAWGILYYIDHPKHSTAGHTTRGKPQSVLYITTLPPSISERCKADPKLLINFLRSTVWKYSEEPAPPSLGPSTSTNDANSPAWLRQLATCPPGLVDLINSRACRSAIMFNDELSMAECEQLVGKLAKCVFPFMCAHSRPSMVPLVDLGVEGEGLGLSSGLLSGLEKEKNGGGRRVKGMGFVDAWKRWKTA